MRSASRVALMQHAHDAGVDRARRHGARHHVGRHPLDAKGAKVQNIYRRGRRIECSTMGIIRMSSVVP